MRLSVPLTILIALVITTVVLGVAWVIFQPSGPPLVEASFSAETLTPNADGEGDVLRIRYTLRKPATVSIYFLDAAQTRFDFRTARPRASGVNEVDFSGIVNPYQLPTDTFSGEILARVLQDGTYTWVIEAVTQEGERNQITGPLTVAQADAALPELSNLTVFPPVFTPNQDGLNDRVTINIALSKDINPDGLHMYLIAADGAQLPIPESVSKIKAGERGLHAYDYDGGIDYGQNPPADGAYVVRAEAEDRLGQRTAITQMLTIERGGLPRADILLGDVQWSASTVAFGEMLHFTLTVENYGTSPIRTSGPPSGYVYDSMKMNANSLREYEQSGVYRVGIGCQTCIGDYPWRWALGTNESLTPLVENGETYYYLMPGARAVVTGAIVLDEIVSARNPQYFWAGLIHEDVEVATINNRVDPELVTILRP